MGEVLGAEVKFIYSEKATKFCEISTKYLSYVLPVKYLVEILQNFVAFSEYMNFTITYLDLQFPGVILKFPPTFLKINCTCKKQTLLCKFSLQ